MAKATEPQRIEEALRRVSDEPSFIQGLLIDALDWPIAGRADEVEEITYRWSKEELRAAELDAKLVEGQVRQVANLDPNQPWGIFILEFRHPEAFLAERGMTGTLRKVLRGLVPSRRKDAGHPSWKREHLLFICTYQYQHYRIAYFKAPPQGTKTAPLAAFGWGPEIPARTACEFNLPSLKWPDNPSDRDRWVSQWSAAFDVAKVTRKFYDEYKREFQNLQDAVGALEGEERKMFAQSLMNRLLFLRFVERKNWFEFPAGRKTRTYLRDLFSAGGIGRKSVYVSRLKPLFFEGLAIEGRQQSDAIGKVHFLNGGLFEPSDSDKKVKDIADSAFASIIGPDGLFYRYNFTVEESTPLDIEVAVDPEMLGKVFEELVTGRHESGSYYTPRPIVAFMCREALKGYLQDKTAAPADAVAAFVDRHEVSGLTEAHGGQIRHALDSLKAVDPACGSGAYLLGLMHELVALYRLLQNEKLVRDPRSLYDLKLRIISHNLYGVDIDPFATNIAMLRLWLSLSVDSDDPVPLPNLDFKIETGDSLTGPCDNVGETLHANMIYQLAEKAVRLKEEYLQAHGDEKAKLKAEIENSRQIIARQLHHDEENGRAIDWYAQFTEVFASPTPFETTVDGKFGFAADAKPQREFKIKSAPARGGFDIVLANPPYVRQELIKEMKPALKEVYAELFGGTADLYVFFYLRGLQLLAPGGMLAYISSNKWFRAKYGRSLRAYIAERCSVQSIIDFGELPVFEAAATFPMIFVCRLGEDLRPTRFIAVSALTAPYPDIRLLLTEKGGDLPSDAIVGSEWTLAHGDVRERMKRMSGRGQPLAQILPRPIYSGIKTGLNAAFWIDSATRDDIISADPSAKKLIKPLARGDDIRRWHLRNKDQFIIYTAPGVAIEQYPSVKRYLASFKAALLARAVSQPWYELQQAQNRTGVWDREKILYPDICREPRFTIDGNRVYADMKGFVIPSADRFLLAVLNSASVWWFLQQKCAVLGDANRGGRLQLKRQYVEQITVPDASPTDRSAIAALAQKCLDAKGVGCEAWEKEIDERISALYGL